MTCPRILITAINAGNPTLCGLRNEEIWYGSLLKHDFYIYEKQLNVVCWSLWEPPVQWGVQ
jgi:hypothetical protein